MLSLCTTCIKMALAIIIHKKLVSGNGNLPSGTNVQEQFEKLCQFLKDEFTSSDIEEWCRRQCRQWQQWQQWHQNQEKKASYMPKEVSNNSPPTIPISMIDKSSMGIDSTNN